jgi:hypothetical protein
MFELFVNPAFLAAGAALISLPIIIHLINRMRFKRIRWAAMEFLLKSQKRNRRRLIIEQLILLALRCFLILLGVILVSRYLGFSWAGIEQQNTVHVVVLDDTPSMTDHWREGGDKTSFQVGKELIVKEIAKNAAQARTHQTLQLVFLSEPDVVAFNQRLNDQSLQDLDKLLADRECTAIRTDLARGVDKAKAIFDENPHDLHMLHLVSDFRQRDWSEPDSAALAKALTEVGKAEIKINLVDVGHPYRNDLQRIPLYHDNLAVVELVPETRVCAERMPVSFRVTVANYGVSERKTRVAVKVNGGERYEGSVNLTIKPGMTASDTFQLTLDQLAPGQSSAPNLITANLENEETGLQIDNTRYAVVEVRKAVPVLIIDGDPTNGRKPGGDTFHLEMLLTAAKGFNVVPRGTSELEQPGLDQYSCIYLLNVRDLTDKALKNLEAYVKEGGSVAFFMGDKVDPRYYNKNLYANGTGLFPAPLADRPNPPVTEPEFNPDLFDNQPKLYVLQEQNPIFAEVWQPNIRGVFNFLPIKRYYPVPRQRWNPEPGRVQELAALPNQKSMREYAAGAGQLAQELDVPINDPKMDKYKAALEAHQKDIRATLLGDKPLFELGNALQALLKDTGDPRDANQPKGASLVEFWNLPDYQKLRGRIEKFRESVLLGDPLVITGDYGKGHVIAFMTSLGRSWTDWAGGSPASITFPAVMLEVQKYLTSAGGENNLTVGQALDLHLDGTRFDNKMRWRYKPEQAQAQAPAAKEELGTVSAGQVSFTFDKARKPGLYLFEFDHRNEQPGTTTKAEPEHRAYVFNVDPAESDLRRGSKDDLEHIAPHVFLRIPNSNWGSDLAQKRNDLSESWYFYLLFLIILVLEQALAVHLSFHLKGGEAAPPAAAGTRTAAGAATAA